MKQAKFGKKPEGERLSLIQKSPNYKNGKFLNVHKTLEIAEGYTTLGVTYDYFFNKGERRRPVDMIPSLKSDLLNLPIEKDILVWFGHSSYFIQIDGKRILVDPVFSGNASPVPGTVKSFKGTDRYTVDGLPDIDYLFISHDHYDHVDFETLVKLKPKTKKVICGLGVGAHFEHWGYSPNKIIERDWNETIHLGNGFIVHTTPARHFSGRGFTRNNTLWMSYLLQTPTMKIYIGGDSGYDTHFAHVGNKHGPIDIAIIDNGQYNVAWRYIHTLPYEVLQAAKDLKAKRLFPVHSSKFVLANHAWDEPLTKVSELNSNSDNPISLVTPMIGEVVLLKDDKQQFKQWWVGVK
jgi:L-ascorbate metabolism protein UlaG (beta-lactamase superfamily)